MVNLSAEGQSEDTLYYNLPDKVSVFEIVYVSLYCQSFVIEVKVSCSAHEEICTVSVVTFDW